MSNDPVERVVAILVREGYETREKLVVRSISFEFEAILVAPDRFDLIIVIDTTLEDSDELPERISALSRALDVSQSQRPVTTVLVGPRPKQSVTEAIARTSRVLLTGPITESISEEDIRHYLAVLLPIRLPPPVDQVAGAMHALSREIESAREIRDVASAEPLITSLVGASKVGKNAVEKELLRVLSEPLAEPEEEAL